MNFSSRVSILIILSLILFGCAQPKKIHVDYGQRASGIRAIGIIAPDIEYYDQSFGGVREKNDKSSQQANQNIVAAISAVLMEKGFQVKTIPREGPLKETIEEVSDLFDTIAMSYNNHVLAARKVDVFPHKAASFDYSVGPTDDILDANHVDALILVEGAALSHGLFTQGGTAILMALVDRTGALLWYEPYTQPDSLLTKDIRDADRVRTIVENMFAKMPAVNK